MQPVYVWIVIEVSLIMLFVVALCLFNTALTCDSPQTTVPLDLDRMQTGDIIGSSFGLPAMMITRSMTRSVWGHVGIIWRCPITNELFVMEGAHYKHPYQGVFKIPFATWLRINKRTLHLGHLQLHRNGVRCCLDPYQLETVFQEYVGATVDMYGLSWLRFGHIAPYEKPDRQESRTCQEICISVLQDMGVVALEYSPAAYLSGDIMARRVDYDNGFHYAECVGFDASEFHHRYESS